MIDHADDVFRYFRVTEDNKMEDFDKLLERIQNYRRTGQAYKEDAQRECAKVVDEALKGMAQE